MHDFLKGARQGTKETLKGYFAPLLAVWRLLWDTTEDLCREVK